mmetsp:Transcript_55327/g.83730  ORF Transcript_55327/g.83730 Transcript_55327/m.83730 type:complete len:157 (+) Transcript_55327:13-483(+)|eukprot:CAMPEP_0117060068 /NCGR_PEP_ID=MMETSP0472-20121206/41749_1 /TAXON_ID=693140 ORGANISM="Tiarina fusus, Strain LIS" /NCGR_SAMPLE_ID=MMETSP0472 /ASSEMBLY_ACC=CAM_ASM_000603 /LENGTH=156 /DNA_ID=CAMNT_0004778069 /DNA_START=13 /DNA_END=483 /DNA_ORIENTATION=-
MADGAAPRERSFFMIKPDGVARGIWVDALGRMQRKGYKLIAMKFVAPSKEHIEKHYEDLSGKPFFPALVEYMMSGPVIATVWEGTGVVKGIRAILGATKPSDSLPGTLRFDYAIEVGRNIVHGSDTVENANKEIAHWFTAEELVGYAQPLEGRIYE